MLLIYLLFKSYPWLYPKIFITRWEDGTLDIQNGNFRDMHYGHFARKLKHVGVVSVQYVTIWPTSVLQKWVCPLDPIGRYQICPPPLFGSPGYATEKSPSVPVMQQYIKPHSTLLVLRQSAHALSAARQPMSDSL
jgi:hypothetical protein